MTALLAVPLMGFAALAIDVGLWELNKNAMQGAADQAALAAGLVMSSGSVSAQNEAKSFAAAYGFVHGANGVTVAVHVPPQAGVHTGSTGAVEVVITQVQEASLSGMFFKVPPTASARAVAAPSPANTCIVALARNGVGLRANGNAGTSTESCNTYINSRDKCAVNISGNSKIAAFDILLSGNEQSRCEVGNAGLVPAHKLVFNAPIAADPYAARAIPIPSFKCTVFDEKPKQITLSPGTYCKDMEIGSNNTATFQSGIYVFNNSSFTLSGNSVVNAEKVTLVFTSSNGLSIKGVTLSGNSKLNLTSMTTGQTAGLAIWIDKAGNPTVDVGGNGYANITGAVYAPSSHVTWTGNGTSPCTQLIAHDIDVSGNAQLRFKHDCAGLGVADVGSTDGYKLKE